MSTYVALANYTERGIQNIRQSPKRLDAVRQELEEMGGQLKSFYLTLGEYDIVFVYEAPDDAISSRFLLLLGASGYVRTKTMKAFPEAAYREIIASLG
jgi:uncharacterized protein with GYD domain